MVLLLYSSSHLVSSILSLRASLYTGLHTAGQSALHLAPKRPVEIGAHDALDRSCSILYGTTRTAFGLRPAPHIGFQSLSPIDPPPFVSATDNPPFSFHSAHEYSASRKSTFIMILPITPAFALFVGALPLAFAQSTSTAAPRPSTSMATVVTTNTAVRSSAAVVSSAVASVTAAPSLVMVAVPTLTACSTYE